MSGRMDKKKTIKWLAVNKMLVLSITLRLRHYSNKIIGLQLTLQKLWQEKIFNACFYFLLFCLSFRSVCFHSPLGSDKPWNKDRMFQVTIN